MNLPRDSILVDQQKRCDLLPPGILESVQKDVAAFFGTDEKLQTVRIFAIKNPYSDVFQITFNIGSTTSCVYLKVPHITSANEDKLQDRLRTEFEVMRSLAARWSENGPYGVVTPIAFYPDIPAIVTLEAVGRPLRERYRTTGRRIGLPAPRSALKECVRRCGLWLREFQRLTASGHCRFDTEELLAYSDVRIDLLTKDTCSGFSVVLGKQLIATIQTIADNELAMTPIAGRHNDFASHNIVSCGSDIRVIDFSMFDHGATAYDPCNFWLDLEMLKYDWTYSRAFLNELQFLFLEGYGGIRADNAAFSLARVRYSLNRLLTALSGSHGWRPDARYRRRAAEVSYDWLAHFAKHGK